MKRIFVLIIAICMMITFIAGCSTDDEKVTNTDKSNDIDELIDDATELLIDKWIDVYNKNLEFNENIDPYLEIKNVRYISINENDIEQFKDLEYVIEYILYSDYGGSAPYYLDSNIYCSVAVYNNGDMEIINNPFKAYFASTYRSDFDGVINEIVDLNSKYDKIYTNLLDDFYDVKDVDTKVDTSTEIDELVTDATDVLIDKWKENYSTVEARDIDLYPYLEIKDTRVISIKDNDVELFEDLEYVIEYSLYTNYFGTYPYVFNVSADYTVVVYKDGEMEVVSNPFKDYSAQTFNWDYSDIIDEITDLNDTYNKVYEDVINI